MAERQLDSRWPSYVLLALWTLAFLLGLFYAFSGARGFSFWLGLLVALLGALLGVLELLTLLAGRSSPISQDASVSFPAPQATVEPMPTRVEILSRERLFDDFFKIDRVVLRHERFDGSMSQELARLVFERGDAVAILPYDHRRRQVLLVRQFRLPAYERDGKGWLWEVVAGTVEAGRNPEEVARSELLEEAGYRLASLHHVMTVYPSPGGATERVHLYLAPMEPQDRISAGGGLRHSGEDILVRAFDLDDALRMMEAGEIADAKTVLALQYAALHWDELF